MPIPDEPIERYLKQFRPIPPAPLRIEKHQREGRRRFVIAAWSAAAAVVLFAAAFTMRSHLQPSHALNGAANAEEVEQFVVSQPLTIGEANALLTHASSFQAAVDLLAFRPHAALLPKGTQSALAVLSKEKTKL